MQPMNVADQRYLKPWLKELGNLKPQKVWREFISSNELPAMDFTNAMSAVYSANIEGNPIDVNSYLASKFRGRTIQFKAKDRKEIENLESAYRFAQTHALNEKNFLLSHGILAATLLEKSSLGKYRDQMVYVYGRAGMEYAALEPEHVSSDMRQLFAEVKQLRNSTLNVARTFYHAALLHLIFVHVHPFMDGNGRAARLLMNLVLIRGGYPPVAVRPEDRKAYLDSLERASLTEDEDLTPYRTLMHQRLDATLGEYLSALKEALPQPEPRRHPQPR